MSASLVGSEMCIRDRGSMIRTKIEKIGRCPPTGASSETSKALNAMGSPCLLYTSDAADDM
eukprot:5687807-Alexandrium_andersonii.AAC.1